MYVSGELNSQAVYWKNGCKHTVAYGAARANAVFVKGTDVYVAGSYFANNGEEYPAYWKNNVKQSISNQDKQGRINFIVVSD